MRLAVVAVVSVLCASCRGASSTETRHTATLAGYWTAGLTEPSGEGWTLALTVEPVKLAYRGTLEIRDNHATRPVELLSLDGDQVHFELSQLHDAFDGRLQGDRIVGTWTQDGVAIPLTFARETPPREPPAASTSGPKLARVQVEIRKLPVTIRIGGTAQLVYELLLTNWGNRNVGVERIEVLDGARTLAVVEGKQLAASVGHPGVDWSIGSAGLDIPPGTFAVAFMWVPVHGASPSTIAHRIAFRSDGATVVTSVAATTLDPAPPRVIAPPLHGRWQAANISNAAAHRRAATFVDGEIRMSQRFAIDFSKIGDDGKELHGDPAVNASYYSYGEPALAVADGVVSEVTDGIPENVPGTTSRAIKIDITNVSGNHVVVDLGGGVFALWAHLQPGSIPVKVGEHVTTGQVLGRVGNSGNADAPHLHFHLVAGPAPVTSEGLPFAFDRFDTARLDALDRRTPRANELPADDDVVTFR
jgi:hypothetical protein